MNFESLNYYGYSRETYKNCKELVFDTNKKHVNILNIWLAIICVFMFSVSYVSLFAVMTGNRLLYVVYFFAALIMELWMRLKKEHSELEVRLAMLLNVLMIASFGIYTSVMQPYMAAVIYPVMLVVLSLSYIETFLVASFVLVISSAVLLYSSYVFKPMSIFYVDLYNIVICLILAFILHYAFQHTRISHFVIYYENVDIQNDLEVKSSFDSLTSLLNRGRFFMMAREILKAPHDDYMAVCLFDLDGFKLINDRLGHQMGDKAIQIMSKTLLDGFNIDFGEKWTFQNRALKEEASIAGRLGGDEYIVLLRGRLNREVVREEVQGILDALSAIRMGELDGLHSSVGIYEVKEDDIDIDDAYMKADRALYKAKEAGKHQMVFFE